MMPNPEKGSGLIVVILVMTFLISAGLALVTVTSTGSRVSGNVRNQEEAFNAAEAGFEAAQLFITDNLSNAAWSDFEGHYLDQPANVDIPTDQNYFRTRTDEELLNVLSAATPNILFYDQGFVASDTRLTYTAFLIDDEAGGGASDPKDAILVSIGVVKSGTRILATSRLEIGLETP